MSDAEFCPAGGERPLTAGEVRLARAMFGNAIDYGKVTIKRRKWFPFQPHNVAMAPSGHIHFPPGSKSYCEDFSQGTLRQQGLFIHEMTHVWQTQKHGRLYLPLHRPFSSRYDYSLKPGWPLERYGIEQQGEIMRHAFYLRKGAKIAGAASREAYDLLVNFPGAAPADGLKAFLSRAD